MSPDSTRPLRLAALVRRSAQGVDIGGSSGEAGDGSQASCGE